MRTRYHNMIGTGLGLLLVAMLVSGCSLFGPQIHHSWDVGRQFEELQIYPDLEYYTSGTLEDPRGIMALKPGYAVDSTGWQKAGMGVDQLDQWIAAQRKPPYAEENTFSNGARIVGPNGELIGYYYSVWEFPLVKLKEDKTIIIAKPLDTYRLTNKFQNELMREEGFSPFH